jgi:hypothetical protein
MDLDPFFDKIRTAPGFANVRAAAIACHENLVANREPDHTEQVPLTRTITACFSIRAYKHGCCSSSGGHPFVG